MFAGRRLRKSILLDELVCNDPVVLGAKCVLDDCSVRYYLGLGRPKAFKSMFHYRIIYCRCL